MTRTVAFFPSVTLDDPPDAAPKPPARCHPLRIARRTCCSQSLLQGVSQQWQAAAAIKEAVSTSQCCGKLKYSGTEYRLQTLARLFPEGDEAASQVATPKACQRIGVHHPLRRT